MFTEEGTVEYVIINGKKVQKELNVNRSSG